jgi:hypothetical protein
MKTLKRIRGLIFANLGWKLLSILIAIAIWALVASEPELSTFATARLVYRNLPDDLELASEPPVDVSLELRGPSGELRGLGDGVRPLVILDMSTVVRGERTFPIGEAQVRLPRRVHLVRAIPSEVRFTFERRMFRSVPVEVRVSGEGQNGYVAANTTAQPATVTVVGPASHVARITTALTDAVDVSNVVGFKEFHVNAFIDDPFVRFQTSPQVVVTVTMKKVR